MTYQNINVCDNTDVEMPLFLRSAMSMKEAKDKRLNCMYFLNNLFTLNFRNPF